MRVRAIGQVQQPDGNKVITHAPGAEFSVNERVGEQLVRARHAVEISDAVRDAPLVLALVPVPVPVPVLSIATAAERHEPVIVDFPDAVTEAKPASVSSKK